MAVRPPSPCIMPCLTGPKDFTAVRRLSDSAALSGIWAFLSTLAWKPTIHSHYTNTLRLLQLASYFFPTHSFSRNFPLFLPTVSLMLHTLHTIATHWSIKLFSLHASWFPVQITFIVTITPPPSLPRKLLQNTDLSAILWFICRR